MKWELNKVANQSNYQAVQTFNVPEETHQIEIHYRLNQVSWLRFLVFDEAGVLRAQKSGIASEGSVTIIAEEDRERLDLPIEETLSFQQGDLNTLSGPIGAGEWRIEYMLDISDKNEVARLGELEANCSSESKSMTNKLAHRPYEVSWKKSGASVFELNEAVLERTLDKAARWYKGDFHTHTVFSDGKMTREQNLEQAVKQGLDFFVATDHDLMPTSWPLSFNCLVLPGVEITSPFGHYNRLFGLTHPYQGSGYQVLNEEEVLVDSFKKTSKEQHLNSVNHPFLTEWKWLAGTLPLAEIETLEIWNDPTYEDNIEATEQALRAWDLLLKDGYQITGIGGSDSHLLPVETYPNSLLPSLIGDPATYVWATALNGQALKTGVRAGKVFVSRFGYEINLTVNGGVIGDHFEEWSPSVAATCEISGPSSLSAIQIEWIIDGQCVTVIDQKEDARMFALDQDGSHYIRVNIRNKSGQLLGFTNPVYFGKKEPVMRTWNDVLEQV